MSCSLGCSLLVSLYFSFRMEPRNLGSNKMVGRTTDSGFSPYQDGRPPMKTYELVDALPKVAASLSERLSLRRPSVLVAVTAAAVSPSSPTLTSTYLDEISLQ